MVILQEITKRSSSSSSTHRYDVFLSFRGVDTRLTFTDHLFNALINANIATFLDDEEIETGEDLKPELEIAIKASKASIIVLSKNYASSTWCLDELVLILGQHRNSDHIVIPIFYHVEPTDVRKQQNSFGDAMAFHKQKMETETNAEKKSQWARKMELWNEALTKVADLKGENAKGRKETDFIEEIVANIRRRLGVPFGRTLPSFTGMDYDIEFITSWLKDGPSHTADILTILGMGGIGKTSLAKYVFGLHSREFQRSSFIDDISRRCAEQFNGLLDIQKQICGDIAKKSSIQVHDVSVYTSIIENTLAHKKVFLVLDDVDSLNQLDVLLGNKGFHPGSKVVITTKDASLTQRCALFNSVVQPKHITRLLGGLDNYESLKLLSFHAFMSNNPKKGYKEVSETLVKYCEGHPLALEVLGRSLRNRGVAEWGDYIERLKKEPDSRIQKILQMSFDHLPSEDDRDLFKHIACFFVGKDRESTETILKACGIHTVVGIRNLIDRCLLSIGLENKLMMHQLLQEMGRDVVRQESRDKPWKRSRLWCHDESFKVLKQKKGKGNLLGLVLDMRMLEKGKSHGSFELRTDALSKMNNLMLLQLNYVHLNGSYKNFPEELIWLCMHGFSVEYIPLDLQLENLVALDMSYSNLKSFDMSFSNPRRLGKREKFIGSCSKDKQLLRSLKILNLSFSKQLHSIGGFFEFPALERLILSNCIGLIKVCESIDQCNELVVIDLSNCNKVRNLPSMVKLKKVETLLLDGCDLSEFPIEMREKDFLEMLDANDIGKDSQTSSSANMKAISRDLKSIMFCLPSSLVSLSLQHAKLSNESFPMDFNCLSSLKNLSLDGNPIVSLPNCVRNLLKLEMLSMTECSNLKTIVCPPRTLTRLKLNGVDSLEEIVFDQEMSPLIYAMSNLRPQTSCRLIEGMIKIEALTDVAEEVVQSLGWSNLKFRNYQNKKAKSWHGRKKRFKAQMYYEFGIFSTIYPEKNIPDWISDRSKMSSISFIIPSSLNNLRGLNFCYGYMHRTINGWMPDIIIHNITKKRTWKYDYSCLEGYVRPKHWIFLSHWMFEKNEMDDGDQVTITISERKRRAGDVIVKECGISLVYDDGKMEEEEDPLSYYKSWNHIIGGDLSPFEKYAAGEYVLNGQWFYCREDFYGNGAYVGQPPRPHLFRAFSQRTRDGIHENRKDGDLEMVPSKPTWDSYGEM